MILAKVDTPSGLITMEFLRLPRIGESIQYKDLIYKVIAVTHVASETDYIWIQVERK